MVNAELALRADWILGCGQYSQLKVIHRDTSSPGYAWQVVEQNQPRLIATD